MITNVIAADQNPLVPAIPDLVWSSVVFVILLTFFWFKVLPNFKKTLDDRTQAIEGRLAAAEQAQAEMAERNAEIEKAQANARSEAAALREQARAEGLAIVAEAKAKADAVADDLVAKAKEQIEAERQAALVSLRSEVGNIAIDLASRVVGESLKSDKVATSVVDSFLSDLESNGKAGKGK